MALPTVVVEIAFNAGWLTEPASRSWTDVTAWVTPEGCSITHGRSDERSTADANQLSLTLDNIDGRFTWGNVSSPYYPNVGIGHPIRVTADGSVRFVGFIESWETVWPSGGDEFSQIAVAATSGLARLGRTTALPSMIQCELSSYTCLGYWPLSGSSRAEAVAPAILTAPLALAGVGAMPEWGEASGLGADESQTAVKMLGGRYLSTTLAWPTEADRGTVGIWFKSTAASTADLIEMSDVGLRVRYVGGAVFCHFGSLGFLSVRTNLDDGEWHLATFTWLVSSGTAYLVLCIDGEVDSTFSTGPFGGFGGSGVRLSIGDDFQGSLAHAFVLQGYYATSDTFEDIYNAGINGFSGESVADRMDRYCGYAGLPTAVWSSAGDTLVDAISQAGVQIVDLLRTLESTEQGVLFDSRDGVLTMKDRADRYGLDIDFGLSGSLEEVGLDYAPRLDTATLANIVNATSATGGLTASAVSRTSRTRYGDYVLDVTTAATSEDEPAAIASWLLHSFDTPTPRAPSVTVDLVNWTADLDDAIDPWDAEIGTVVQLSDLPAQAPEDPAIYVIEGWSESITKNEWSISFNLSPIGLNNKVLRLDDSDMDKLDAGRVVAL